MISTLNERMTAFDRRLALAFQQVNRLAERARRLQLRSPRPILNGLRTSVYFRRKLRPWFQTYRPNGRLVVSFGLLYFAVMWSPPPWLLRERTTHA